MKITGQHPFKAPPAIVWEAICDPDILTACIPQCEKVTRESDTRWVGEARVRIGPVKVLFTGIIVLSDVLPPESYTITIEASGWVGKAHGLSHVRLLPAADALLDKAMNLASRVASELAESFFTKLAAEVEKRQDK